MGCLTKRVDIDLPSFIQRLETARTPYQLINDKTALNQAVLDEANEDFLKMGIKIDFINIQNISDNDDYIINLGKKRAAEIKRDAEIGQANAERDSLKNTSNAEAEGVKVANENKVAIFESNKIKKILHNAKFDYHMLLKEGIKLNNIVLDTMIGMHILNENMKSYALKNLSNTILKIEYNKFDELFGKDSKFNTIKIGRA